MNGCYDEEIFVRILWLLVKHSTIMMVPKEENCLHGAQRQFKFAFLQQIKL